MYEPSCRTFSLLGVTCWSGVLSESNPTALVFVLLVETHHVGRWTLALERPPHHHALVALDELHHVLEGGDRWSVLVGVVLPEVDVVPPHSCLEDTDRRHPSRHVRLAGRVGLGRHL